MCRLVPKLRVGALLRQVVDQDGHEDHYDAADEVGKEQEHPIPRLDLCVACLHRTFVKSGTMTNASNFDCTQSLHIKVKAHRSAHHRNARRPVAYIRDAAAPGGLRHPVHGIIIIIIRSHARVVVYASCTYFKISRTSQDRGDQVGRIPVIAMAEITRAGVRGAISHVGTKAVTKHMSATGTYRKR